MRSGAFKESAIFFAVSGMNGSSKEAPIKMLSIKLYITVDRRSFFDSSFASTHGAVSSIYLLQRLNRVKISVIASATRSLSMRAVTLEAVEVTTSNKDSSTGSLTP